MNDHLNNEIAIEKWTKVARWVLGVIAVAGLAFAGQYFWKQQAEKKSVEAFAALELAVQIEESALKDSKVLSQDALEIMKDWSEDKKTEYKNSLNKVIQAYPGTVAAKLAELRLGRWNFINANFEEAEKVFQSLLANDKSGQELYKAMAYEGLGLSFENREKWDDALKVYNDALAFKDNPLKPLAYLGKARVLRAQGKQGDANSAYEALIKEFPNSHYERKAKALLSKEVSGEAATEAPKL